MDELGIDRALMWPTLASLLEERLRDDPPATHAVIHALNQWMHEHWTFGYEERIFPTPIITLAIVDGPSRAGVGARAGGPDHARPARAGARLPGPRSMALPEFDPFWERVAEADILVGMHASDSGYAVVNEWEGVRQGEMMPFKDGSAFRAILGHQHRAIDDAMASLIAHGCAAGSPTAVRPGGERQRLGPAPARRHGPDLRRQPQASPRTRSWPSSATSTCIPSTRRTRSAWSSCSAPTGPVRVGLPHPEGMADPLSSWTSSGLPHEDIVPRSWAATSTG